MHIKSKRVLSSLRPSNITPRFIFTQSFTNSSIGLELLLWGKVTLENLSLLAPIFRVIWQRNTTKWVFIPGSWGLKSMVFCARTRRSKFAILSLFRLSLLTLTTGNPTRVLPGPNRNLRKWMELYSLTTSAWNRAWSKGGFPSRWRTWRKGPKCSFWGTRLTKGRRTAWRQSGRRECTIKSQWRRWAPRPDRMWAKF